MPQSTIPPPPRMPVQTQSHPADSAVTCIYQCDQHGTPTFSANGPWTIWGPGLIALGGVLITLTVKWIQDRRAAKHDLRRELFLKVTDAITNGGVLLGSVARSNISIDELGDRFVKFIAPLNQAEVVADKPLLAALTVLKNQTGLAFGDAYSHPASHGSSFDRHRYKQAFDRGCLGGDQSYLGGGEPPGCRWH